MIIKSEQARGQCDHGQDCPRPATHAAVARGATGRWCEVLWYCEPCAQQAAGGPEHVLTTDQARRKIALNDNPNDYPDF